MASLEASAAAFLPLARSDAADRTAGILRAALDCIVTVDVHGRILEFNPAAENTFGYKASEVIGRDMAELIIPERFRARHHHGMERHLRTGEISMLGKRIEIHAMRSNGFEFPCELTIAKLETGGQPTFTAFLRDITERKAAEDRIHALNANLERQVEERTRELRATIARLEATRQRLETAQAIARLGDIEVDLETGERFWSPEAFRLHGFPVSDTPPSHAEFLARVHLEDQPRLRQHLRESLRGEARPPTDYRVIHPNGSIHWIRVTERVETSPVTRRQTLAATLQDVTEIKAAEHELLSKIEIERELGQLKTNFLHMVTHEYRTPLGVIMSSSQILQRYMERLSPDERRDQLEQIQRSAQRLGKLVDEVLFLGRSDAGSVQLECGAIELETFFEELRTEILTGLGAERTVHLNFTSPKQVLADERLLRHIFGNLLSNALKYSTLDCAVWITTEVQGDRLRISVRDEGIGIPTEDQRQIFQIFRRASNVGTISGSGVGLSIVKRCVDLHQGEISLTSAVGKGTEVTVLLPLQLPPSVPASAFPVHEERAHPDRRRRTANESQHRDNPSNGGLRSTGGSPRQGRRKNGGGKPA